jgi:Glycosyltransferase family 87
VRRVIAEIPVFLPTGADAYAFVIDGRRALTDPGAIYPQSAAQLAQGWLFVTLYPPPQLLIAAVYALAPDPVGAYLWVATNIVCAAIALFLLFRLIRRIHPSTAPIFCLLVICFTPLFEDIRLGQRGGLLLLLGVGSMTSLVASRPRVAGALAGLATALKFYPGALVLGVQPRRHWSYGVSLLATAVAVLGVSFIPFGSPLLYFSKVLLPGITWNGYRDHDCFQNSTQLLFARVVGGEKFSLIDQSGTWRTVTLVPWHLIQLAAILTDVSLVLIIAATLWAVWRSSWSQPYALALCFSLGTIVPGEVFTYQFLPLLPLFVLVFMKALEGRRVGLLLTMAGAEWILLVSPCSLPLPSLWTVAALAIFAVAVYMAPEFRQAPRQSGSTEDTTVQ